MGTVNEISLHGKDLNAYMIQPGTVIFFPGDDLVLNLKVRFDYFGIATQNKSKTGLFLMILGYKDGDSCRIIARDRGEYYFTRHSGGNYSSDDMPFVLEKNTLREINKLFCSKK